MLHSTQHQPRPKATAQAKQDLPREDVTGENNYPNERRQSTGPLKQTCEAQRHSTRPASVRGREGAPKNKNPGHQTRGDDPIT